MAHIAHQMILWVLRKATVNSVSSVKEKLEMRGKAKRNSPVLLCLLTAVFKYVSKFPSAATLQHYRPTDKWPTPRIYRGGVGHSPLFFNLPPPDLVGT